MADILQFPPQLRLVRQRALERFVERHKAIVTGAADPRRPKPQFLSPDELREARRLLAPELEDKE